VLSLWNDTDVGRLWLDSAYPTGKSPQKPGVLRGPCPGGERSTSAYLRAESPNAHGAYSQVKFVRINSTFIATGNRRMAAPTCD
jgi:cellulose 1,4-beta-cellobiosidase